MCHAGAPKHRSVAAASRLSRAYVNTMLATPPTRLSLVIAFLIGFLLECLIGLISFWFLEVSSLIFIFMMVNYFLSGHMLPLDWLPNLFGRWPSVQESVRTGMMFLPFPYLAYFPASLMLGKQSGADLWVHLAVGAIWVVLLLAANRIAFARGVRRYSAFGG